MKTNFKRIARNITILGTITLTLTASFCGISFLSLINAAKAVTAASAPALDRMVARKIITDTQKKAVRGFLDGTTSNLTVTQDEWIAAAGNKTKQVLAVQNSVNREAQVVATVTNLPAEAQTIIDDVMAAFQIIAAFYGANLPQELRPAPGAMMETVPLSEKEMERRVRAKIESLKLKLQ